MSKLPPLLPERHPQRDFFIADIFDSLPFKDDMATMEHPLFSLSTKPDKRALTYSQAGFTIEIQPSYWGLPTIFDKDVLLYIGSQMMDRINRGETPPKTIRLSLHDLLVVTNRRTSGEGYKLIKNSLNRLTGSLIRTNIKTGNRRQEGFFHILESSHLIESTRVKGRVISVEITLSDWYYHSLIARQVLTIDRDYFRLRKSIDRRLYEIARKHCGSQPQWSIQLDALLAKSGSRDVLKKFRAAVRLLEKENHLPEYKVAYNRELDQVTFINRTVKQIDGPRQGELDLPPAEIPPDLVEEVRAINRKLDAYGLWNEWQEWNREKGNQLLDWRRAFVGFCRRKAQ